MKKKNRLVALFLALICMMPLAVACGKKGIQVDRSQAMEQLQMSDAKTQESKNAEMESKKQATLNKTPTPKETKPAPKPVETKGPVEAVPLDDPTLYYDPNKRVPDVYDPADTRELLVKSVSYSDGDYAVVYGECAVGALVTIKSEFGEFSVQSEGGCFAMRILSPDVHAVFEVSQSYDGQPIGDTLSYEGNILLPENGADWSVWIGYENQGFFHKMIPDVERTNLLTEEQIQATKDRYAERVENLKTVGDGCEMICLLVPASLTIYPELAPPEVMTPGTGETRFDQVANLLTEAGATVIDMRETFLAHKHDSLPLFSNNDSHWAEYGSYLAYVELYDYISDRYPDATPYKFDDFTWEWDYYTGGDMPWFFDIDQGDSYIYEYQYQRNMKFDSVPAVRGLTRYKTPHNMSYQAYGDEVNNGSSYNTHRPELPDIYVYRNSYGATIYDLMLDRSNKATFNPTFTFVYNFAQIKQAAPDYVIIILSEWDFGKIIDN